MKHTRTGILLGLALALRRYPRRLDRPRLRPGVQHRRRRHRGASRRPGRPGSGRSRLDEDLRPRRRAHRRRRGRLRPRHHRAGPQPGTHRGPHLPAFRRPRGRHRTHLQRRGLHRRRGPPPSPTSPRPSARRSARGSGSTPD
ncbi:hypothetical protein QP028_05215 [Corynebacterium suedekumii]|nr:hypothetical protein QP028_05215 [Corynebacterium suedekumii]